LPTKRRALACGSLQELIGSPSGLLGRGGLTHETS
jgi:hypothetical protein